MSGKKANRQTVIVALNSAAAAVVLAHGIGAEIAFNSSGGAADWIMLSPLGPKGLIRTVDNRGPFKVADPAKLIEACLNAHAGRIPIDENHATDLAAPNGGPSPARGWIVEMQARTDGIFGRVEWSAAGSQLMSERAYRYISPVFICDKAGNVLDMPRVSLTNTPNLRGMATLHSQESDMDLLQQLRNILGLGADIDQAGVIAKVKDACSSSTAMNAIAKAAGVAETADSATVLNAVTALKSGLAPIAKAAGLKEDADSGSIVTAINALSAAAGGDSAQTIVALQSEVKDLGEKLSTSLATTAREKAVAFVDGAIRDGRVGVKPLREHYITMHAQDPARVEKEISAMPKIGGGHLPSVPPQIKDGKVELNSDQLKIAEMLGVKPEDYAKTLASENAAG